MTGSELELAPEKPSGAMQLAGSKAGMAEKVMTMIDHMITSGNVNAESAVALKELTGLVVQMRQLDSKEEFNRTLKEFQAECKKVIPTGVVMNREDKGGGIRYRYAKFEDLMAQIQPMADRHGFSINFTEVDSQPGRIAKECIIAKGLHEHRSKYSVRIGKGPGGCNETQADGAAHTYAKRGALCDALNIVIDKDTDGAPDDAAMEGADITEEQARSLCSRVTATGSDHFKFLALACGTKLSPDTASKEDMEAEYRKIPVGMYAELDDFLSKRERIQAAKKK